MWRARMRRETKSREEGRGKGEGTLPRLARVIRQILGAPDYQAYLDHCRDAGHPPLLDQREYVNDFFERKGRTVRCC